MLYTEPPCFRDRVLNTVEFSQKQHPPKNWTNQSKVKSLDMITASQN